jgi:hypothetical protein
MTRVPRLIGDRLRREAHRECRTISGQIRHILTEWAEKQNAGGRDAAA